MKKLLAFSVVLFSFILFSGCSSLSVLVSGYKPLVIEWPKIVEQTNVPAMNQGVLVTAPRDVWLNVTKTSGYGTTAIVLGMPPGGQFFFPADNNFREGSTIVITVRGYDGRGNLLGIVSKPFMFTGGTSSYYFNQYWNVRRGELQ